MLQLLLGSVLLSLIHAAIPNHWIPIVAIGKAEKWSQREILMVAAVSGFAHTLSTVLVGITIGLIGIGLSRNYAFIAETVAPSVLILLGIIYLVIDFMRHHKHTHGTNAGRIRNRSKWAIITSLAIAMFLSPCIEIEAYYFQAGSMGWSGIIMLSVIYVLITVSGMVVLVFLGNKGVQAIQSHFLDHHEKLLSGLVLILLGIFGLLVRF